MGFCALPARAALLAVVTDPMWIIPVQALDGLGGAVFGVITPLVAADISGRGGRFNLRMGILGLAIGVAATVSNTVAGAIASNLGAQTAFIALGAGRDLRGADGGAGDAGDAAIAGGGVSGFRHWKFSPASRFSPPSPPAREPGLACR